MKFAKLLHLTPVLCFYRNYSPPPLSVGDQSYSVEIYF